MVLSYAPQLRGVPYSKCCPRSSFPYNPDLCVWTRPRARLGRWTVRAGGLGVFTSPPVSQPSYLEHKHVVHDPRLLRLRHADIITHHTRISLLRTPSTSTGLLHVPSEPFHIRKCYPAGVFTWLPRLTVALLVVVYIECRNDHHLWFT